MEKDINNLYFLLTKHNPFPSNCLPSSDKLNNRGSAKKLLQISRSIADIVNRDSDSFYHKKKQSQVKIQNLTNISVDNSQHPNRIHHNFTHFSKLVAVRTGSLKPYKSEQQGGNKANFQTLPCKANQTAINTDSSKTGRRKDIYDDHIEKYMSTKFNNEELIEKYLTDRDNFIKQACLDIEKDIKKQYHVESHTSRKNKMKKYSSHLPKIQETATHMLKKSTTKINDATYIQQMSQLKRIEELQLKDRKRKQRAFKRKMNSLESRINRLKSITQR